MEKIQHEGIQKVKLHMIVTVLSGIVAVVLVTVATVTLLLVPAARLLDRYFVQQMTTIVTTIRMPTAIENQTSA